MAGDSRAVFLSYASQDAPVAQSICSALQAAGIEVWFDQGEVRGGDAWDQKIRRQIHDCVLFLAILSRHTQARLEGYFRLEWHLADRRTQLMAKSRPFLLPVCVDDLQESTAEVPESFSTVHWFRLRGADELPRLVARVSQLLLAEGGGAGPQVTPVPGPGSLSPFPEDPTYQQSIAVLPFVDLSERQDQGYLADGIAEEIRYLLGTLPALRVIGRTWSFQVRRDLEAGLRQLRALGVANVVEGSVRRAGGRIRVTARLIDSRDGTQRWSETYTRDDADIFQVQDEIAASLVSALKLEVTPDVVSGLHSRQVSREAHDVYLRGLHAVYRLDQRGCEEAAAHFKHAIRLDASFLAPLEMLALTLDLLTEWKFVAPAVGFEETRTVAERALALNPRSAVAHAVLGNIHTQFDWDRLKAAEEIRCALEIAPRNPAVLVMAAKERIVCGAWADAERILSMAATVDPFQPAAFFTRGVVNQRLGRLGDAERDFRRALAISPNYARAHARIAEVLVTRGEPAEALAEVQKESGGLQLKGLAVVYHALGRTEEADTALARLEAVSGASSPMYLAEVYAFRGETDAAFTWLERARAQKDVEVSYLMGHPFLARLVSDPRYAQLLSSMNLSA
jgi:TolB-like protein/Flp pilus assembly protein TadD